MHTKSSKSIQTIIRELITPHGGIMITGDFCNIGESGVVDFELDYHTRIRDKG